MQAAVYETLSEEAVFCVIPNACRSAEAKLEMVSGSVIASGSVTRGLSLGNVMMHRWFCLGN